jgi:hypothetical protein
LGSTVERDGYSQLVAKHNEIVKRGENPGSAHLKKRKNGGNSSNAKTITQAAKASSATGVSVSKQPSISPAVALDEDGQDICTFPFVLSNL